MQITKTLLNDLIPGVFHVELKKNETSFAEFKRFGFHHQEVIQNGETILSIKKQGLSQSWKISGQLQAEFKFNGNIKNTQIAEVKCKQTAAKTWELIFKNQSTLIQVRNRLFKRQITIENAANLSPKNQHILLSYLALLLH